MKPSPATQRLILLAIVFAGAVLFPPKTAQAATNVSGNISSDQTWTKSGSPYVIDSNLRLNAGVRLNIEAGVIVKFRPGAELGPDLGFIQAVGTTTDPIIFTSYADDTVAGDTNGDGNGSMPRSSDWLGIHAHNTASNIQFAEIRYGSTCLIPDRSSLTVVQNNLVKNCAIGIDAGVLFGGVIKNNVLENNQYGIRAWFPDGVKITENSISKSSVFGIYLRDDAVSAEVKQNNIFENGTGIFADHVASLIVENNNIYDNGTGAVNKTPIAGGVTQPEMDARNNWWGHASGPSHPDKNPIGSGNSISNGIIFVPWLASPFDKPPPPPPLARNPVIIVPGILGSELYNGEDLIWADFSKITFPSTGLDTLLMNANGQSLQNIEVGDIVKKIEKANVILFNYSEALIQQLTTLGYSENTNLFIFPYDWREDLNEISLQLEGFINTKIPLGQKADIIAHSMGGLVTKRYILENGKNKIDKLIFIGTPHLGAPKAGKALLFGDPLGISILSSVEIKKIGRNMPALNQLLPSQKYFQIIGGYLKTEKLLNYQETKNSLFSNDLNQYLINQAEDFHSSGINNVDLSGIEVFNINGCNTDTLGTFRINLGSSLMAVNPQMTRGDGTVPLESSTFVNATLNQTYFVKGTQHATMMTDEPIRKLVTAILGDEEYSHDRIIQDQSQCKLKGKILGIFSPVDVKITDQDGNYSGPNEFGGIDENIPGASYQVFGEEKFVYLPTDEGQIYDIELDATDAGGFDLKIQDIDDRVQNTIYYNSVGIVPSSTANFVLSDVSLGSSIQFDYEGDGSFETLNNSSVLNESQSLDETPPETSLIANGTLGTNEWYRSDVVVTLLASDDNAGILKTEYSLDDGATWNIYTAPFQISSEASAIVNFFSTDNAGNREEIKREILKIDKTPPEAGIHFDPLAKNLIFTGADNLSDVTVMDAGGVVTLTDEAGNTTKLYLQEKDRKRSLRAELLKISYNDTEETINRNRFRFNWSYDKNGQLKELNQTLRSKKEFTISLEYNAKKNITHIKIKGGGKIKETKPGLIILNIKINKGRIGYGY